MRVLASIILAALLFAGEAYAQGDYWFGVEYNTVLPQGNADDFAGGFSWRGGSFGGRRLVKENVSVGFWAGWHVMDEKTDEISSFEGDNAGLDISGTQFRYINSFPLMLNAHYYAGQYGSLRPFVGLNAGIYYIERRVEVSVFVVDEEKVHFGLAPEAGLTFPLGWQARGLLSARYNWAASAGGSGAIGYWNFSIGAAWQQ
jgi:outer membrane protein W